MGDGSKIEWCDATWNPLVGCSVCAVDPRPAAEFIGAYMDLSVNRTSGQEKADASDHD